MSAKSKTFYEREVERIAQDHLLMEYQYIHIRNSTAFMKKYHAEKIELGDIAAAAFMSRFYYIRIFKQIYGVTPRQYLKDLRISKAKELLKKAEAMDPRDPENHYGQARSCWPPRSRSASERLPVKVGSEGTAEATEHPQLSARGAINYADWLVHVC